MNDPSKSKIDVEELFGDGGAEDIGLDDNSSSIIIANLNATTLPMCVGTPIEEMESDDNLILFFAIDESPSMEDVEQTLIEAFNDILIPGLRGGSKGTTQGMEIAGLAFCEKINSLWGGGFTKLEDLPKLTSADYSTKRGNATALYQAMLDALTACTVRAAEVLQETGTPPKVIIVILSDGANNCLPSNPDDVKMVADKLSREIFVPAFVGFETWEQVNFKDIAAKTGFSATFEVTGGGDKDELRRKFRHLVGVMSSSIITTSKQTISADTSSTFWQDSDT